MKVLYCNFLFQAYFITVYYDILDEYQTRPTSNPRGVTIFHYNQEEREWWEMNREMDGLRRMSIRGKSEEDRIIGNEEIG